MCDRNLYNVFYEKGYEKKSWIILKLLSTLLRWRPSDNLDRLVPLDRFQFIV